MKIMHPFRTLILQAAIGCIVLHGIAAHAATILWTNTASGGWNTAASWNPNSVPGTNDTAVITNAGVTVSLNSATTVGTVILGTNGPGTVTLSLNNQTLSLAGPLTVNPSGSFTVNSGSLAGITNANAMLSGAIVWTAGSLGGTFTLATNCTLTLAGNGNGNGNNLVFYNCVLTNYGTVLWSNGYPDGGGSTPGTLVYNYGLWVAQSDWNFKNDGAGNGTVFNNYGTFRKSAGAGNSQTLFQGGVVFNQLSGQVDLQQGNLVLQGGGNFTGGTATNNNGSLALSVGNFNLNGTVTGTNVYESNGNLVGNNVINGSLNWYGPGNWNSASSVTISVNSTLIIDGSHNGNVNLAMNNVVMTNFGTVTWQSSNFGDNGTVIYNYGLWDAQSDQGFGNSSGAVFNNYGTFRKSGGAGNSYTYFGNGVVFNQLAGVLDVQSGTNGLQLQLNSGGTFTGGYITTNSRGFTVFNNGNFNLNGTVTSTNVVENYNGSLVGTNVILGGFYWAGGGNWNGAQFVIIPTNSTLIINGGSSALYLQNSVVTNYGTVVWQSSNFGDNGNAIYNYGLWDAQSDQGFGNSSGTVFNNYGTFRKSGGAGSGSYTYFGNGVVFNQLAGVLDVQSGTNGLNIQLNGGGNFTGGYITTNAQGMTYLNNGNFNLNGTVTSTNVVESYNGSLVGTNVIMGGFTWSVGVGGGNWDGAQFVTISNNSTLILNGGLGNNMSIHNSIVTNYGIVDWVSGNLQSGNTKLFNYGLWDTQSDQQLANSSGTVFNNFGTFRKSGGAGNSYTYFGNGLVFNQLAGVVDVQSGTNGLNIQLNGGGNFTGGYITTNAQGMMYLNNGNFNLNGTVTSTNVVENYNGSLVGTNVIQGGFTWSVGVGGGNWNSAQFVTISTNSTLIMAGGLGNNMVIQNSVVTNYGIVDWVSGNLQSGNTKLFNYGLWDAQSDQQFANSSGAVFNNYGTFRKSGGAGGGSYTYFGNGVVFNQLAGVVDVQSGTNGLIVLLNSGGTFTGGYITTNSGGVTLFNNGNFNLNGTVTSTNVLENYQGNLVGTNIILGGFTWQGAAGGGNWNGAQFVTISTNSTLILNGGLGNNMYMQNSMVTNYGTVVWQSGNLKPGSTTLFNYGLWNVQCDQQMGSGGVFNNLGAFVKTAGTNTSSTLVQSSFFNSGLLDGEMGVISLQGAYGLTNGKLNFGINSLNNYGTISLAGAASLTGSIGVNFNNGFVPATGNQFPLVSFGSHTGTFNATNLPLGASFTYASTSATLVWNGLSQAWATGSSALHGTITVTILVSPGTTVQLVASANGVSHLLGTITTSGLNTITLDTTQLPNGVYTLQAIVYNGTGQVVGNYSRTVFVNNSLAWHEGTLSASQTWGTNVVNVLDQNIVIPSGVTLTLAPGAIVKFTKGTGIIVQSGGILDASGAAASQPIILTSMADDSAGGDSNEDGNNSIPLPGDWNGITASGQFNTTFYVQIRYVIQSHSGLISQSQEWSGSIEHLITGSITVPTNVTLTIDPGAIVKVGLGLNLTVQSGGTLIAAGTVAQPIIFTSIKDESIGANTNTVVTTPAAGDWDSIYLNGGQATFNHVTLEYGGGPDSLNSGLISLTAAGSVVTVSNSVLSQGFYKGINAEYGTVNVNNCLIAGCDRGIQAGLNGQTLVNIINCTLDNNNYGLFAHGGIMNVANTIVADSLSYGAAFCCGSSLALFEHNDVWSGAGVNYSGISDQTGINGNISANPKFLNAAQGNYELNYGSHAIDAADGTLAPLSDLTGAPRYNDPRTLVKTGITNASGVYPDMGALEFVETASSPVDLIVNSVVGPLSETAGQTVTVQWNDVNIGTAGAAGPWHDTISLVPQNGGTALVVGTVLLAQNVVLGPGQSYPASASVVVPGGLAGAYQWQVQVNSQGNIFEGVNWTNNITLSPASSTLADPTLTIGGTVLTNVFTAVGQSSVFALVSSGTPFALNVLGNTPNCGLELFVADGYVPSPAHYDFKSSQFNSSSASLTVPSNNHDTYYMVVYVASLNAGSVSYTLSATQLGFALNSVSPASMANSGPVTLQILGDQLAVNDTYSLTGSGGTFGASAVQTPDPTVAYATFNLGGGAAGLYSLQVAQPAGPTLTLSNAVNAISVTNVAAKAALSIQLELPPAYRQSRPFNGTIVYRNTGQINMPAPLLVLTSGGVAGMALPGSTNFLTSDMVLIGASFEGPAGTLTPGQSWRIPFTALCTSGATIPFAVNYKTADATDLINYNTLQTSVRPPGYCNSTWNTIWSSFQAEAGPTWGGFVSLVDSYSTQMALTNAPGRFYVLRDVLAFAFAELANGACTNGLSLTPPPPSLTTNQNSGPFQLIASAHSADPNDKFATGIGLPEWLADGDVITYTVEFENQPNASAPAQTVSISDSLTTNLDWSTLQLTAIAFNNAVLEIPPGVQTFSTNVYVGTDPNPVVISASLNPVTGVLSWLIESIDPVTGQLVTDPLAGFLPPDNFFGQGEGYVTYTIEPRSGLATGTQITNQASIVFDLNAAIMTPITTNIMDVTPPTSSVTSLPANSNPNIPVSWFGSDVGSGIAGYDIYVSANGGPWMPWLLDTTNTAALFSGAYSNNYAFYSVAYDAVGNIEAGPAIPGANTVVPLVRITISPSGAGSLKLTWPQGKLLQSTSLTGPWTTNTAASSPYTLPPNTPQMFFKIFVN